MTDRIHIVGFVVSVLLLAVVLELVRRKKLAEEYSFVWIGFALALVALSLRRDLLHVTARWLGIYYPPIVLLLVLVLMVFVGALGLLDCRLTPAKADRAADRGNRRPRGGSSGAALAPGAKRWAVPPRHVVAGARDDG